MKKYFLIILPLFLLCLFIAKSTYAAVVMTKPIGVDLSGQNGPNPAPPIGLTPCGSTMCNENETCMKYRMEPYEHCVPTDLIPLVQPVPPKDLPDGLDMCPTGTGVFPPNSTCLNNFTYTQDKIKEFERTCIYEPIVEYTSSRSVDRSPEYLHQDFVYCGTPGTYAGPDPAPEPPGSVPVEDCSVSMLVYTDVQDVEVGSYGPNQDTRNNKSTDYVSQNYLYDSLFGKELDLSKANRESSRTYWRMMSASAQANLRSFILNMANEKELTSITFKYTNAMGIESSIDTQSLYDKLKKQVILFWHWPFIRIGCLVDYPVCPEYAQAFSELKPSLQSISESIAKTPGISTIMGPVVNAYQSVSTLLGSDTQDAYSAFTPLDFDSARDYIVKKKDETEDIMYHRDYNEELLKDILYPPQKPNITNISRENTPYINAIYQGLLSPKFGILSALQPGWMTEKWATPEGSIISDYKRGNDPNDFPEVKIARENWLSFLTSQVGNSPLTALTNLTGWIYNQIQSLFSDPSAKIKGYLDRNVDLRRDQVVPIYINFKGCPMPVSYHLLSPKTGPGKSPIPPGDTKYDNHHQVVTIWGPQIKWTWAPTAFSTYRCTTNRITGIEVCKCHPFANDIHKYQEGDPCVGYRRHWKVYGVDHGKALTVANNPKQTDIKNAIVQDTNISLYKTLIPDSFNKKKITDAGIDAPYAMNYSSFLDDSGASTPPTPGGSPDDKCKKPPGQTATSPNGQSCVINEVEPVNRINNRAQDTMHLLQNCWVVPGELQNSPRCLLAMSASTATESACTGEAFKKIVGDPDKPSAAGESYFSSFIKPKLSNDVMDAYADAEKNTGVPCEVLAGIHFKEGDNNPDQDLQSGAPLAGRSLTESANQAAEELLGKAGGPLTNLNQLIMALSYYNGGGNSNCQAGGSNSCAPTDQCGQFVACATDTNACKCNANGNEPGSCRANCPTGFPYPLSYNYCPPSSTGYDDPYVTNFWKSPMHDQMYILYKYDCTQTRPYQDARPGTLTVAISLFLDETK